jgi:2-oxoglutarate dehydrogenase E2 component (dihydrolipoamide succinyltransferase)
MPFDIVMPQMGESIAEATILKWHRQVGEAIAKDETLYEISTDKVDAEIPSPLGGILLEILVPVNTTVPVGSIVARLGKAGEKPSPTLASGIIEAPEVDSPAPIAASTHPLAPEDANSLEARLASKSSPLVRKMAEVHGVDLRSLKGSGLLGRVTKEDMEAHLARMASASVDSRPSEIPPAKVISAPSEATIPSRTPAFAPGERVRVEPMSRMRKIISDNMLASKRTSAHVYTVFEIDMTRVAAMRQKHRKAFEEAHNTKLSFLPFIMAAVAGALRAFPIVNASVDGDSIVYKQDVHLGIAVNLDWGLLVPVVRHADQLNLGGLARHLNDLATRARAKQLKPEEIQEGTFTITNPGVYGDVFGLPIINQPQVAILGIGNIVKRPVVVTSPDGSDALAIRHMMFSSLSFDHRIIDGATADQFMAFIKKELETSAFGLE